MATRSEARAAVVQLLYAHEMGNESVLAQAGNFLQENKVRHRQYDFAMELLLGTLQHEEIITQVMAAFLKTWDISRLGVVEKSILKLGIYELLQTNTQEPIVINEAIELTRVFNVGDAARLVNGVLDSIAKKSGDEIADMLEQRGDSKDSKDAKIKKPAKSLSKKGKK